MKKKMDFIRILFFLLLFAPVTLFPAAKTSADDVPPPSILPVILLSGSNYDMGYQYGLQAGHSIEINKTAAWASALQRFSRDAIILALKANQHYIQEYTPENIEIMKGMAAGASAAGYDVTYEDILLLNGTLPKPESSRYPKGAENDALPPPKGCSVCSAWGSTTKDGRLIGLDTLDGDGESMYGVVIVAFPDDGNHYICVADAGEIGDHFLMNNKGFFLGNSGGGGSPREMDEDYGLGWTCSLPHIVRFANNAKEARDMILGWQINVPENFHLADIHGNAFVVEKTAAVQAVRKPGDFGERDFLFSTNNYLHKKMSVTKKGAFIKKHGGYGGYSAPRNLVFWDLLNNYRGHVDFEFMKMILRFPGNPPPYPPEGGWDATICRPTNCWVSVARPHDGDEGIAYICTGPAGRVIHSSMASNGKPMRSNYQFVDGTHTFFKLRLAANPKAVVEQAKADAKDELSAAYKEFMQLKPRDDGYAIFKKIYSNANTDYYQGNLALNKALLSEGNEALLLFAEAASGYARCQAHAQEVYEALKPPPTSPSDLGLRSFGGDWVDWETLVGKEKIQDAG
jgi:hypothetical protein